jgi:hypothetical protein
MIAHQNTQQYEDKKSEDIASLGKWIRFGVEVTNPLKRIKSGGDAQQWETAAGLPAVVAVFSYELIVSASWTLPATKLDSRQAIQIGIQKPNVKNDEANVKHMIRAWSRCQAHSCGIYSMALAFASPAITHTPWQPTSAAESGLRQGRRGGHGRFGGMGPCE